MTCPLCKKPSLFDFRPFCSKRCADLDLGHWLQGDYVIEGEEESEPSDPDPSLTVRISHGF